jgi:BirA family biotin operon repressor/biotin-[acetyl-CoA-carboxylase] ligase
MIKILKSDDISRHIRTAVLGRKIICLPTVDSTNKECRRRAFDEEEGTVIISEEQTGGKGRLGRGWCSPGYKGIWMSLLLKPDIPGERVPQITQIGAAALCLALEMKGINRAEIKWPNDILIDGKKVSGILTETQAKGERTEYVILGIGLNVNLAESDFLLELRSKATSLYLVSGRLWDRAELAAEIINAFEPLYLKYVRDNDLSHTLEVCRQRSAVIGKSVLLIKGGVSQPAQVLDLGSQGELIVRMADGQEERLVSGELSLQIGNAEIPNQ